MDCQIDPPIPPAPAVPWTVAMVQRVRRYTLLKTLGICAFMWVFFIGYFYVMRNPAHPLTIMPQTALDRLIPFQPQALVAYVSLWLYIGVAPGLLRSWRELVHYCLWIAALCLAGLACFYLWPTAVQPPELDLSNYAGFAILKGVDSYSNACPSLHVATAIFTAVWVDHLLRHLRVPRLLRLLNGAWFLAIAYSTLAIKQHVALDALAGALFGLAFALPSLRWRPPTC